MSRQELRQHVGRLQKLNKGLERAKVKFGGSSDSSSFRSRLRDELNSGEEVAESLRYELTVKTTDSYSFTDTVDRLDSEGQHAIIRFESLSTQLRTLLETTAPTLDALATGDSHASLAGQRTATEMVSGQIRVQSQSAVNEELQQVGFQVVSIDHVLVEKEQRLKQVEEIAEGVHELNEAFHDVNALVSEQQEDIDALEANVSEAKDNVQKGARNLEKAASHQSAYRRKMCYLMMALMVVALLITLGFCIVPNGFCHG